MSRRLLGVEQHETASDAVAKIEVVVGEQPANVGETGVVVERAGVLLDDRSCGGEGCDQAAAARPFEEGVDHHGRGAALGEPAVEVLLAKPLEAEIASVSPRRELDRGAQVADAGPS
jgi:hypothetical protein